MCKSLVNGSKYLTSVCIVFTYLVKSNLYLLKSVSVESTTPYNFCVPAAGKSNFGVAS